jgi:hypothetical protein
MKHNKQEKPMPRITFNAATFSIILLALLILPAQIEAACTKTNLQTALNRYIAAQTAGNPSALPLAENVKYSENLKPSMLEGGIVSSAIPIAFHRDFFDTTQCRTFSEIVVTEGKQPYVLGVRLTVNGSVITEIESIVTTEGDWKFSAENYLKYSPEEDWHVLKTEERVDRKALMTAADAWLDQFTYENVKVPWGIPCARLEGGEYTGDGPRTTCKTGIPAETIEIVNRSYVVDEDMGTVNIFSRFGKSAADSRFGETPGLPDSHTIRVVEGKLRYIHTITAIGY